MCSYNCRVVVEDSFRKKERVEQAVSVGAFRFETRIGRRTEHYSTPLTWRNVSTEPSKSHESRFLSLTICKNTEPWVACTHQERVSPDEPFLTNALLPLGSRSLRKTSKIMSANSPRRVSLPVRLVSFFVIPTGSLKSNPSRDKRLYASSRQTDSHRKSPKIFICSSKRQFKFVSIWNAIAKTKIPSFDLFSSNRVFIVWLVTTEPPVNSPPTGSTNRLRLVRLWRNNINYIQR